MGYWMEYILVPFLFAICVLLFFVLEEQRIPYVIILVICVISAGGILLVTWRTFTQGTALGIVSRIVHCLGELGMVVLLAYQAHIWNQKKKKGMKSP